MLSMVMIARDERENIRDCFDTFWEHVDEVVLCDTGSRDGTIAEARRFAKDRGEPDKLIVGHFPWCDDFGAARTHAHSLASGDVHAYVDLDDRIIGGRASPGVGAALRGEPQAGLHRAPVFGSGSAGGWERDAERSHGQIRASHVPSARTLVRADLGGTGARRR
jgi:glycosyltransferase involved in cell wall biosynthesis